jgi:hypothetical protein
MVSALAAIAPYGPMFSTAGARHLADWLRDVAHEFPDLPHRAAEEPADFAKY